MSCKLLGAAALAGALLLTGCASVQRSTEGFNATDVDPFVKVNETKLAEVRALLGTPTTTARTVSDNALVIGYSLSGEGGAGAFARNFGKGMLTFGFGATSFQFTVKNVVFKFDADNIVTDYRKSGVAYLQKHRVLFWNECERRLTDGEVNSTVNYSPEEICQSYAQDVARKEGIAVDDVDTGKEFEFCNLLCQNLRALTEAFGELKEASNMVSSEDGDGSKGHLIFK